MLEGLYNVNWKNLSHASGEAGDVPGMLLALTSPVEEERAFGFMLLYQNLCHQGAIYEASAYTVTYLNQLLEHPLFEEKPRLLKFLAELSRGQAPLDAFYNAGLIRMNKRDPEVRFQLSRERYWAQTAKDSVQSCSRLYIRQLDHFDADVRMAAAFLVSHLADHDEDLLGNLSRRMVLEIDPVVRAGLVFAIGRHLDDHQKADFDLEDYSRSGEYPLIRLAGLMTRARSSKVTPTLDVMVGLVDVLSSLDRPLAIEYARLPWAEGHMYADIAMSLCYFGSDIGCNAIPDLMRVLDRVDVHSAISIAYAMLYLGMSDEAGEGPFTEIQTALLSSIAGSPQLWKKPAPTGRLLAHFELPQSPDAIYTLLNNWN